MYQSTSYRFTILVERNRFLQRVLSVATVATGLIWALTQIGPIMDPLNPFAALAIISVIAWIVAGVRGASLDAEWRRMNGAPKRRRKMMHSFR